MVPCDALQYNGHKTGCECQTLHHLPPIEGHVFVAPGWKFKGVIFPLITKWFQTLKLYQDWKYQNSILSSCLRAGLAMQAKMSVAGQTRQTSVEIQPHSVLQGLVHKQHLENSIHGREPGSSVSASQGEDQAKTCSMKITSSSFIMKSEVLWVYLQAYVKHWPDKKKGNQLNNLQCLAPYRFSSPFHLACNTTTFCCSWCPHNCQHDYAPCLIPFIVGLRILVFRKLVK